jgi:hypothetical protein
MNGFLNANSSDCPVDFIHINENKVRIVAFIVLLAIGTFILTGFWPLVLFLVFDFGTRAFVSRSWSLLAKTAGVIVKIGGIGLKPIDQAPKRFSAGIGFLFCVSILGFWFLGWDEVSIGLSAVLGIFCFLEAAFGFCAGCHVYSLLKKINFIS